MFKLLLSLFLLFPVLSQAQSAIENTGSNVTPEDAQAVLDLHNKVRAELGILPLTWSADVAAFAQQWADSLANFNDCKIEHHSNELGYGENIFGGSPASAFKGIDAANSWLKEKEKYTYSKLGEGNWYETGHYTQMIWKSTTEVGLGMATCPNGGIVIVGNYSPAGNMSGEYPY